VAATEDPFECSTERLLLCRPVDDDLDAVFLLHSDPATYAHNPTTPDLDVAASRRRLHGWIDDWSDHGFGYWSVRSTADGEVVGFAGVRHSQWLAQPVLNLYYRFRPDTWGRGLATEAARHAVSLSAVHVPVLARTRPANIASQRTALAAGLIRRADLDRGDSGGVSTILVSHWPADAHG
jgi:ribosomal-protein-alanine N-acetyltransferase